MSKNNYIYLNVNSFNCLTHQQYFDTINDYQAKLENINKQLRGFIVPLRAVKYLINKIRTGTDNVKYILTNEQVVEFEKLIEDCEDYLTPDKIEDYQVKLENVNKQLRNFDWQKQGLCRYCGSKFSGFFSKKCSSCGKAKDY